MRSPVLLLSKSIKTFLVWLNHKGTEWWMEDEMRSDLSLHPPSTFPPTASSYLTLARVVGSPWAASDIPVLSPAKLPPCFLHQHVQACHFPPIPTQLYAWLLEHSSSRTLLQPTCMHKRHRSLTTTQPLQTDSCAFFSVILKTWAPGCRLIRDGDITRSLPQMISWIRAMEPWSPLIQTDTPHRRLPYIHQQRQGGKNHLSHLAVCFCLH